MDHLERYQIRINQKIEKLTLHQSELGQHHPAKAASFS